MSRESMASGHQFVAVSETAGEPVPREQILRAFSRYSWASAQAPIGRMLEIGCGAGQGLELLARSASLLAAGDISPALLAQAARAAPRGTLLVHFDAHRLPFRSGSFDSILISEAIYYLSDVDAFMAECLRILSARGQVLFVSANKDLFDFNPSPLSRQYLGVVELAGLLKRHDFAGEFYGDYRMAALSWRQRIVRPIKWLAVKARLVPKTMAGKRIIKRFMFGAMEPMPAVLDPNAFQVGSPTPLPSDRPDRDHKVIYCRARRT